MRVFVCMYVCLSVCLSVCLYLRISMVFYLSFVIIVIMLLRFLFFFLLLYFCVRFFIRFTFFYLVGNMGRLSECDWLWLCLTCLIRLPLRYFHLYTVTTCCCCCSSSLSFHSVPLCFCNPHRHFLLLFFPSSFLQNTPRWVMTPLAGR